MYDTHCPVIAAAMRADIATFKRGLYFVICSIRQPILAVPEQVTEVERYGAGAACIWGHKRASIPYVDEHAARLHSALLTMSDPVEALRLLCDVPGLGIVKSAFTLQLMGWDVACLDSRNVKREGRNPRAFRTDGKPPSQRKLDAYIRETGGKARRYWDAWCRDVAKANKRKPDQISALHLCITQPLQFELEDTFT